jgi:hypothetical protein
MGPAERGVQQCHVTRWHLDLVESAERKAIGEKAERLANLAKTWPRVADQLLDINKVKPPRRERAP